MRLWSIQHKSAYDQLQKEGVLHANEKYLFFITSGFNCEDAYDWMADQLEQRVGKAPNGVHYPIWAWYQWEGQRKRLDMRMGAFNHFDEKGTPIVLLTLEIPDHLVLLSDFDMWHCVMNQWSACFFSEDIEKIHTVQDIRESWNNIFMWDKITEDWPEPKTTQAVFWEIKKEWVINAESFVSR